MPVHPKLWQLKMVIIHTLRHIEYVWNAIKWKTYIYTHYVHILMTLSCKLRSYYFKCYIKISTCWLSQCKSLVSQWMNEFKMMHSCVTCEIWWFNFCFMLDVHHVKWSRSIQLIQMYFSNSIQTIWNTRVLNEYIFNWGTFATTKQDLIFAWTNPLSIWTVHQSFSFRHTHTQSHIVSTLVLNLPLAVLVLRWVFFAPVSSSSQLCLRW